MDSKKTIHILTRLTRRKPLVFSDKVINGVYVGSSMLDYFSDVVTRTDSSAKIFDDKLYHDPREIGIAVAEIFIFTLFSVLANSAAKKKNIRLKQLNSAWQYTRSTCSAVKNGRHAVVNIGSLAQIIMQRAAIHHSVYALSNPIGLAVGGLYAAIVIWHRYENNKRTKAIASNQKLLEKITHENLTHLTDLQIQSGYSKTKSAFMYTAAFSDGLLDGLYMFGNIVLILSLVHVSLLAMPVVALVFAFLVITVVTAISIINKMVGEHKQQRELQKSADLCDLIIQKNKLVIEKDKKALGLENTYDKDLHTYNKALADFDIKYNKPYTPLTKFEKIFWPVARACINAAKNSDKALKAVGKFVRHGVSTIAILILGGLYSLYLGIKKYLEKSKTVAIKNSAKEKNNMQNNSSSSPLSKKEIGDENKKPDVLPRHIKLTLFGKSHGQVKIPQLPRPATSTTFEAAAAAA